MFLIFWELCVNKSGAETTEEEIVFQITNPIPKYTKYSLKSETENTVP